MITRQDVEPCLFNFLGYGNPNGKVWFMGTEEGGAEIWRFGTVSLLESLQFRSKFLLAMDFRHVWEDLYRIPLESFKGPATWRFMAAFLLSFQNIRPTTVNISQYIFYDKNLGSLTSDHFLCEFMPLPKPEKESIQPYETVWKSNDQYQREVGPKRIQLLLQTLQDKPDVKLIISYDRGIVNRILQSTESNKEWDWSFKQQTYSLWKLQISPRRHLYLLKTPFFGQGQISYEGIWEVAQYQSIIEL